MTVKLINPNMPGAAEIDFTSTEGASRIVEGTAADLIRDGHDKPLRWLHNGHALPDNRCKAFLLGRGWSATVEKRKRIADAGIPTLAINDYPADGPKPDYWCTGDPPVYFTERIWTDPDVMKFVGIHNLNHDRPRDGAYATKHTPKDAPNTNFFHQATDETDLEYWLFHPYVSWGTTLGCEDCPPQLFAQGAARSSMLIGLRILWHLGYREIYLLGCDCTSHQHPAPMYWPTIFHLMDKLRPTFDRFHYRVYQTNHHSHLRSFDFADFDDALKQDTLSEPTKRDGVF